MVIAESRNDVAVHVLTCSRVGKVGALAKEGAEDVEYGE